MLLQATIGRKYFVETQTIVATFGPSDLSLIFLSGMGLERGVGLCPKVHFFALKKIVQ